MPPIDKGSEECETQKNHELFDKQIQTSKTLIVEDSKTFLQISKSSSNHELEKGSVTLFEYCQISPNADCPKAVPIIKKSFSEEVQQHPKSLSSEEEVTDKKKHSQEAIKPYLDQASLSKEKLIRDVLELVQNFPNYRLRIESCEIEYKTDSRESSKLDAVTSFDSKPSEAIMEKEDKNKDNKPTKIVQRPGCFPSEYDTPSGMPDPGCDIKPRKSTTSTESVEKVESKKSVSPKPKTGACPPKNKEFCTVCDPTCEAECHVMPTEKKEKPKRQTEPKESNQTCPPPIDYCTKAKPKDEVLDKDKKSSSEALGKSKPPEKVASVTIKKEKPAPKKKEPQKTDSQCSSIKCAMENFITKVCSTTNETFTLIRKGSVDPGDSPCDEEEENKKKEHDSKGFRFFRKVDSLSLDQDNKEYTSENIITNAVIDDTNVDSEVSNINETVNFRDLPDSKPKIHNESDPIANDCNPKDIANIIVDTNPATVQQSGSVFTTIKTKIRSFFGDERKKDDISFQGDDDEDADLMERLIE